MHEKIIIIYDQNQNTFQVNNVLCTFYTSKTLVYRLCKVLIYSINSSAGTNKTKTIEYKNIFTFQTSRLSSITLLSVKRISKESSSNVLETSFDIPETSLKKFFFLKIKKLSIIGAPFLKTELYRLQFHCLVSWPFQKSGGQLDSCICSGRNRRQNVSESSTSVTARGQE